MTTARDIHEHMMGVGTWVDWQKTCDGFKYGDPDAEITGIAVGWQSLQSELEAAHSLGCNLFITHEPTFYSHMDDDESLKMTAPARRKAEFLDRTGMVVYRCHDVWDVFPKAGVIDSWGEFLGLGEPCKSDGYYRLYDLPAVPAWELVDRIKQAVNHLGETGVQYMGTRWQMVSRLAIGTGAITDVRQMAEMGADVVLATNDGMSTWRDGSWALDQGIPLIIVDHRTSEIPGIRNLAKYVESQFPQIPSRYVGPDCSVGLLASKLSPEVPVRMRRDDLHGLSDVCIPEGYECRPMTADEVWAYQAVMNDSIYTNAVGDDWFQRQFGADAEYDPSFLQIIWKGSRPVAAAGAWHTLVDGERWGMIHWVGVCRSERGKGLGKAIVLAALHRLAERGFTHALLDTQGWRLPAIAAYMRLGFQPWPNERAPQAHWDKVLADMVAWRKWGAPGPRDG